MKRWFYILLGGLGVCLSLTSVVMVCFPVNLPPPYPTPVAICEYVFIPLGLLLGWMGFINGREAGEYSVSDYIRTTRRRRDHHVIGKEISFECPVCHKGYRASPLLAGKPFTCRDCQQGFMVPESSSLSQINERRLLPEPV